MVRDNYCAPYSKQPCIVYEVNMWYSYYITLFVLNSFTLFSVSHDLTLTLSSKNRKIRKKNKMKMKMKNKIERN